MEYVVAIVEDVPAEAEALERCFQRYSSMCGDCFDIRVFHNGNEFILNYHPMFDLVMMDINMPQCNGMDASIALRKMDQNVALIFVTSMIQYAAKGYEVEAVDFVLKPVNYQSFAMKLQRVLRRIAVMRSSDIALSTQYGMHRIAVSRIKYIEVTNHSLIYHTTEGNVVTSGRMSDAESRLSKAGFIRCSRCYLVNPAFVQAVQGSVIVIGEEQLQISRPKRASVLEALNRYYGGGRME